MTKPSKYAPAPWSFDDTHFFIRDKDEKHVGQVFKIWLNDKDVDKERALANARLIAAAPDLYETLCSMIHVLTEIATATKLDLEKTVIKAKDQATGKEASVSAMTVFIDALSVISKVSGETNE